MGMNDTLNQARVLARRRVHGALVRAGHRASAATTARTRRLFGFVQLGAWVGAFADELPPSVDSRQAVFDIALQHVHGETPLYLEFGVFRGDSLRWWSKHLTQPGAQLVGFDSFEGLPEDWNVYMPRGAFAVPEVPKFDDPRVSLEVGWFDDTLPGFKLPDHDALVVNVDCDLYSSTVLVLKHMAEHLVPGTLIYFDELHDRDHEQQALMEYLAAAPHRLVPLAMSNDGAHWLFKVTEGGQDA